MSSNSVNHKNTTPFFYKLLSMLSVVRGYNIFAVVIAQYLAALFIFSPQKSLKLTLTNKSLFLIVLATVFVIAAGYIINNFYDEEKDKINKPQKSKIDHLVSQKTKLSVYFTFNLIGCLLGFIISIKAGIFFTTYIFLIWFYSHKLKKHAIPRLISATVLSLLPFFVIFVFYKNFSSLIFVHASFLFFILLIKELIKDLENIKGDLLINYKTIPIKYGERKTKIIIFILALLTLLPLTIILTYEEIGGMKYYFYFAITVLIFTIIYLFWANHVKQYNTLHNVIKVLIVIGIFSLMLIDYNIIIKRLI